MDVAELCFGVITALNLLAGVGLGFFGIMTGLRQYPATGHLQAA